MLRDYFYNYELNESVLHWIEIALGDNWKKPDNFDYTPGDLYDNKKKLITEFTFLFFAFNCLYSYAYVDKEKEMTRLRSFLENVLPRLAADFNPLPLMTDKRWQNGIYCLKNSRRQLYQEKKQPFHSTRQNQIYTAFVHLYKVRCNLFHGRKSPEELEDLRLIKEGRDALQHFFIHYFKKVK